MQFVCKNDFSLLLNLGRDVTVLVTTFEGRVFQQKERLQRSKNLCGWGARWYENLHV